MALTEAAKEAIWLKGLACDLGLQQRSVTVKCDSQNAICLAKNQVFHASTKHIEVITEFEIGSIPERSRRRKFTRTRMHPTF